LFVKALSENKHFIQSIDELFKGRHFEREIIILCVRWYLRFKLSFRDLVEMMAERGIDLAHTTIMRWIQRYVPEFEKRWNRFACKAGGSWRVEETYVKIKGCWTYLYRAVWHRQVVRRVDSWFENRRRNGLVEERGHTATA
jgi:transposase-like protein